MKIAIIGSGISGLSAAYLLHNHHDITVYEKSDYLGGHSRTVDVNIGNKTIPVDTGFIVFNKRNYPNLTQLFKHIGVNISKSKMSFGVSIEDGWLEYGTASIGSMFGQRANMFRLPYWRMIKDIIRFNNQAHHYIDKDTSITLGECLKDMNMGTWFIHYYLLAMGASIWSTPADNMLEFPAKTFIHFFHNHGLLTVNNQPQWYTVKGGSKEYVKRLTSGFTKHIKTNCGVTKVKRFKNHVTITDTQNNTTKYDHVIFACHPDQSLKMLDKPTAKEKKIIGSFKYQPNHMVLHSDPSFMPKRQNTWSSWVYLANTHAHKKPSISLTYWMNNLQPLNTDTPLFVTLNPTTSPDPSTIYDQYDFSHPVFNEKAINAQKDVPSIQGENNTWYCGAWQRYGFHEDGLTSALNVVRALGVDTPW